MKLSDRIFRFLMAFICGSAVAVGNVFCLTTSFHIPVDSDLLFLLCVSASLLFSLAYVFKRAWIGVTIVTAVMVGICVYKGEEVLYSIIFAVKTVMEQFIRAYENLSGLTVIADVPVGTTATAFMAIIGALMSWLTVTTVSKRYSLLPMALASVLLLLPCMLIINSMPEAWAFVLLVGTYVLLVMTQLRRRYSENGQYLMTFVMAIPVIIFTTIIVNAVQPESYERSQELLNLRDDFKGVMEKYAIFEKDELTGEVEFISPVVEETLGAASWNENVNETNLNTVGPQIKTGLPVMAVYSESDGSCYLKGNSLGIYEDNRWSAIAEEAYEGITITNGLWLGDGTAQEILKVHTNSRSSIIYSPYMILELPENSEIYYDSYISNSDNMIEYSFPVGNNVPSLEISSEYEEFVHGVYTQVPDETREALKEITEQLTQKAWMESDRTAMDVVAEYVQSSAKYDLNTPGVPDGKDFVTWFLNESDTGYCVHFASAATVLLRCMDIPARYVSGYLVDTKAGQWSTVTQDDAHAWVEFYIDGYGWRKLEPTPAISESETIPEQTDLPEVQEQENNIQAPIKTIEGDEGTDSEKKGVSSVVWIVGIVILVIALWCPVMRQIRRVVLKKGTYNERAIKYYRCIMFLSKLSKLTIDESVEELAMKARFSQHRLTKEELDMLIEQYGALCTMLRAEKAIHKYVLYHFILTLPKKNNS